MSCAQCTAGEADPTRDGFAPGCERCAARAYAATRADLLPGGYMPALRDRFGPRAAAVDVMVKDWLSRMAQATAAKAADSTSTDPAPVARRTRGKR